MTGAVSGARESTSGATEEYEVSSEIRLWWWSLPKTRSTEAPIFKKGNARVLFLAGSAQDIEFDHGRVLRIDFSDDFHGVAPDRIEDEFFVGGERCFADVLMIPPQRLKVSGRFHGQIVADHGQPTGQGHNLVPVLGRFAGVHVEDDQDAALAIRSRRRERGRPTARPRQS